MSVSRPKRARASLDQEEEPVSPVKSKQRRPRSPSIPNGRGHSSSRPSASPHPRQAKNMPDESGDESIDVVGVDQSSSSASVHSDVPKKPTKLTPSKNTKNSKLPTEASDLQEEPTLYCLVQHPVASTTPLPSVPASTCYKCNKKLNVVSNGRKHFSLLCKLTRLSASTRCDVAFVWLCVHRLRKDQSKLSQLVPHLLLFAFAEAC